MAEEIKKYILPVAGLLVAGFALYKLGKDDDASLDPKIFTEDFMINLLDELKMEYLCIYVRNNNRCLNMLKMKGKSSIDHSDRAELIEVINQDKMNKLMQVCGQKQPRISTEALQKWVAANKNHPKVKANAEMLNQIEDDLINKFELNHEGFVLPEKLTKERYMRIYKKIFASLRFDFWSKCQDQVEKEKLMDITKVPRERMDQIWNEEVWSTFEKVRCEIFNFLMNEEEGKTVYTEADCKRLMQQAYVQYARQTEEEKKKFEASHFADAVTHVANEHHRILDNIRQGILGNVTVDPRSTLEDSTAVVSKANFLRSATSAPKKAMEEIEIQESKPDEGASAPKKPDEGASAPKKPLQNDFIEKLKNEKQME